MRYLKAASLCAVVGMVVALLPMTALAQQGIINTVAGGGPNNVPALQANVYYPYGVVSDGAGNYYIAASNACRVYKVNSSGVLTVVAGDGFCNDRGDGGQATKAEVYYPTGVAVDSVGNVYIANPYDCDVRKVDTSGIISVYAGTRGICSFGGDGGPATAAGAYLSYPYSIATDAAGNLYIGDFNNYRIRKVDIGVNLSTIAGSGTAGYSGDGVSGGATSIAMSNPESVAVDASGNLYWDDTSNYVIREVDTTGTSYTVAGTPGTSLQNPNGDGGAATSATIGYIYGLTTDHATPATIYLSDYSDCVVRAFQVGGVINTVVGQSFACGSGGDGGPATSANLYYPYGVAADGLGNLFIAQQLTFTVREAALGGNINTVAGNGTNNFPGNNVPATGADLNYPEGVAADHAGNFYIADSTNCVVRKVDTSGIITLFAGTTLSCGFSGDGGAATSAKLNFPTGVAVDASGNVYIADTDNLRIREVDAGGNISTFAGGGGSGFCGDGGPATSACLYYPEGVAVDKTGNVYIADYDNLRVRKVNTGGLISTFAGNGNSGYDGEGPATAHSLSYPSGVAVDFAGTVYIADQGNYRVRKVDQFGNMSTWAGNGSCCTIINNTVADQTSLYLPWSVATDPAGDVLVGTLYSDLVVLVDGQQMLHFYAGTQSDYDFLGDGGPALSAALRYAYGVGTDQSGNAYIADSNNLRIREVSAIANLNASRYNVVFNLQPIKTTSGAQQVTLAATGPISFGGITLSDTTHFSESDGCGGVNTGQTCTADFYFTPGSAAGTFYATASVNSNSFYGSPFTIYLTASSTGVSVAPTSITFKNTPVGLKSTAKNVKVSNKSSNTLTFGAPAISPNFQLVAPTASPACGAPVAAGGFCYYGVVAVPAHVGVLTGSLAIYDSDGSSPQFVSLSVTGTIGTASPTALSFGTITVGSTAAAKKVTVKYSGPGSLTFTPVTFSGPNGTDFGVAASGNTCSTSTPLVSGGSCFWLLNFTPSAATTESGTAHINGTTSVGGGSLPVALSGTGQ